jgi:hypothetical protein
MGFVSGVGLEFRVQGSRLGGERRERALVCVCVCVHGCLRSEGAYAHIQAPHSTCVCACARIRASHSTHARTHAGARARTNTDTDTDTDTDTHHAGDGAQQPQIPRQKGFLLRAAYGVFLTYPPWLVPEKLLSCLDPVGREGRRRREDVRKSGREEGRTGGEGRREQKKRSRGWDGVEEGKRNHCHARGPCPHVCVCVCVCVCV